jgi:TolB-like protein/tetratricopeptide (TPR) repeat protein
VEEVADGTAGDAAHAGTAAAHAGPRDGEAEEAGRPRTVREGDVRTGRPRGTWRRLRAAAAAAGMAAGVLLSMAMRGAEGAAVEMELAADDPRRVAVLVLEDLSPGGELRPLASGITERLIGELSRVPALDVRPLAAVAAYRGGRTRFADMVGELRVGSVVEGTLQRSGDSVWITLSLVNAASGRRLQTHEAVLPADGGVAAARDLAVEVSGVVRRRLGDEVRLRAAVNAEDADARLLVQRAEQLRRDARQVGGSGHPADVLSALELLSASDSLLARARRAGGDGVPSTLARGWNDAVRARLRGDEPAVAERLLRAAQASADSVLARGDTAAARALELRGRARYWRAVAMTDSVRQRAMLGAAERDLRRATAARPGLAGAWSALSQLLRLSGRLAEGELAARRALAEDAYLDDGADIRYILFYSALWMGDYPRAEEACSAGRRLFPGNFRFVECGLTLLRNDLSLPPRPAAAWALAAELDRVDPPAHARQAGRPYSPVYRRMLAAAVSARAGEADRARAEVARARRQAQADPPLSLSLDYDEMWVRQMLGDTAAARRLLREMQRSRPWMATYLSRDPFVRGMGGTVAMDMGPAPR